MNDKGPFYWDLQGQLEIIINNYEYDRERYWSKTMGDVGNAFLNTFYEQAERFAKAVLSSTETLVAVEKTEAGLCDLEQELQRIKEYPDYANIASGQIMDSDKPFEEKKRIILELLLEKPPEPEDEGSPLRLVWERLFIDLALDAVLKFDEGVSRIFRLYRVMMKTQPSPGTQKFLARLGRCYVWGFDSECVILCRSVLDTAFRDSVDNSVCQKHISSSRESDFTLFNRIDAAFKAGIIDKATRNTAFKVKNRGDKAVHYQPGITEQVWETICDTLDVLEKIVKHDTNFRRSG